MNEQNSKKDTRKKDKSTRPLYDTVDSVQQTKEENRARHRNSGQSEHRVGGWWWYKLLALVATFLYKSLALLIPAVLTLAGLIVAVWHWQVDQVDTIATLQKDRAWVVLPTPDFQIEPDPALSFSLIFKNMGATAALNTYGAHLRGECQHTSSQECIPWCLEPLRETQGERYGDLPSQGEHTEEFFYPLKTGRARKKQRPIYFCGYFAYTDVFCVWRRYFYVLSYDSSTDLLTRHALKNDEEKAQAQNCRR